MAADRLLFVMKVDGLIFDMEYFESILEKSHAIFMFGNPAHHRAWATSPWSSVNASFADMKRMTCLSKTESFVQFMEGRWGGAVSVETFYRNFNDSLIISLERFLDAFEKAMVVCHGDHWAGCIEGVRQALCLPQTYVRKPAFLGWALERSLQWTFIELRSNYVAMEGDPLSLALCSDVVLLFSRRLLSHFLVSIDRDCEAKWRESSAVEGSPTGQGGKKLTGEWSS